uniref:Olfactory receptor 73 n=1 Tax=Aulacocentrum confusum TaxID=2767324 RepID=A0A7G8Z992_9HYME|nr:olfactory receptor 73 [Aulacocentrum confusum]
MMIHRRDASTLHQTLDPKFFELMKNPQLPNILLNDVSSFRNLCKILSSFTYLSCAVFIMTPLILMMNQHFHQIHPIKLMFVIPGAYPWNIPPYGLVYKFHFIAESASIIFALIVSGGIDSLFTLYIFQISGQLREMSYRITHTNSKTTGHKKIIRECILQHEVLMQCRDILEKIYGPVILFTMLVNAMNLCSQMFEFTQMMNVSIQRAIFFTIYMMFKFVQTFVYAWAGSQLTAESQKYKEAVYGSHWQSNKNFMTSIIIMLGQRPLVLTACKFSIVSIDIFVKVVNTAISYLFLLQTIHDKK